MNNKQTLEEKIKFDFGIDTFTQIQEMCSLLSSQEFQEFIESLQEQVVILPQISLDNYKTIADIEEIINTGIGDNMAPNYMDDDQIRYRVNLLKRLEENLENSISNNEKEKPKEHTKSILDFGARRYRQ